LISALVFRWRSRTLAFLMCHIVTRRPIEGNGGGSSASSRLDTTIRTA
jgi:hypothetical protein